MNKSQFFQWAGYLSNPARRTRIDVESHPSKEQQFREQYFSLTGILLGPADAEPSFVVLKAGVDKYGVQRRAYFFGDESAMPQMESVTPRKASSKKQWRINNKDFVTELFSHGFLIGDNTGREPVIRNKIPPEFLPAFDLGFGLATLEERAEILVYQSYTNQGTRTLPFSDVRREWGGAERDLRNALHTLKERGVIREHPDKKMITLNASPEMIINNEIEKLEMRRAIGGEKDAEKREYLIETYARNRGWKNLARKKFGSRCMYGQCENTFITSNGSPYIEVHHIVPLHAGGDDGIWNLSVLCAHHHRMAHFARVQERDELKEFLLRKNRDILK